MSRLGQFHLSARLTQSKKNILQGSVKIKDPTTPLMRWYSRCGRMFNHYFITNFQENVSAKELVRYVLHVYLSTFLMVNFGPTTNAIPNNYIFTN